MHSLTLLRDFVMGGVLTTLDYTIFTAFLRFTSRRIISQPLLLLRTLLNNNDAFFFFFPEPPSKSRVPSSPNLDTSFITAT